MRIAYLSTDPGVAYGGHKGASVHIAEIVSALAAEGNDVLLMVAAVAPGASTPDGITLEVLPGDRKAATVDDRLAGEDDLAAWIADRVQAFRPAALYERLALHSAAGATVARALGIPYLVEINAPLIEEASRFRRLDRPQEADALERTVLARADRVFAVSPPLVDHALARGARQVEVLQNAANVARHPPATQRVASPIAVFAGSMRPWHGIETIAEAWRSMGSEAPALLVVGDGPARGLLDGLDARVTGAVAPERVPSLLAGAHIGLAPSGVDSPTYFSPLKVFEYLAAGLATVAADLPAVTAVVDADTAVVVPAGDVASLADAVARLCADADERERLGRNGRALIMAGHTWPHRARRILDVVRELAPAEAVMA